MTISHVIADTLGIPAPKSLTLETEDYSQRPEVQDYIIRKEDYSFRTRMVSTFTAWMQEPNGNEGIWLYGPTGSGKTSFAEQLFAHFGIPCVTQQVTSKTKFKTLLGARTLIDGELLYEHGPLTKAMELGIPCIIDEIDRMDPHESVGFHQIMETGKVTIEENGGEVVQARPGFRLIATGNSAGNSDPMGNYKVRGQDLAFRDRFIYLEVPYPTQEEELAILMKKKPAFGEPAMTVLIKIANDVRKQFMGAGDMQASSLDITISVRKNVQIAHYAMLHKNVAKMGIDPLTYAFDMCLLGSASESTKVAVHNLIDLHQGKNKSKAA
jgi:cobaltochelatase CobS